MIRQEMAGAEICGVCGQPGEQDGGSASQRVRKEFAESRARIPTAGTWGIRLWKTVATMVAQFYRCFGGSHHSSKNRSKDGAPQSVGELAKKLGCATRPGSVTDNTVAPHSKLQDGFPRGWSLSRYAMAFLIPVWIRSASTNLHGSLF